MHLALVVFPFFQLVQTFHLLRWWLSPVAPCASGTFSSSHWRKHCTCTRATCTVWWWSMVVVYIYNYILNCNLHCIYLSYVVLGHGANLCRVQNGQDGLPLRSHCVRLKYSLWTASNEKEVVRNKAYAPTSNPGKDTGIGRRNSAN